MIESLSDGSEDFLQSPVPEVPAGKDVALEVDVRNRKIYLSSNIRLDKLTGFDSLVLVQEEAPSYRAISLPLRGVNCFILRYMLIGKKVALIGDSGAVLKKFADTVELPRAYFGKDEKHIVLRTPGVKQYDEILSSLGAYVVSNGEIRVNSNRIADFLALAKNVECFPNFIIEDRIIESMEEPILGFDGTLDSLKEIPVGVLNIVKNNIKTYKGKKSSTKTIEDDLAKFGIETLFDLLLWLPRRYVDKSKPQSIRDLNINEPATIAGTVSEIFVMGDNKAVVFTIQDDTGGQVRVTFWRQMWLRNKFPEGSKVVITGKVSIYKGYKQINGTSIEMADKAAILPILPIYKQSETKGITSLFISGMVREMFSRLGPIELPPYFKRDGRIDYYKAYKELHLPEDIDGIIEVVDDLAYLELVYMQMIIQRDKEQEEGKRGPTADTEELKNKAIEDLPYTLTDYQVDALEKLAKSFRDGTPSRTLILADTGSGKTIISQLSCLELVQAGYQAVLLGPTDVLARQLYSTFLPIIEALKEKGETIRIEYLGGQTKAKEKKNILSGIADGDVQIVVGTHAAINESVKYKNLGIVCVDEQQKFGAEQRVALLDPGSGDIVPHLLMTSATPIPRSIAQVFYGDMDMIELHGKPPGRIPVEVQWIQEDPYEMLGQATNEVWQDIRDEADKGNQTFVITPLVVDNEKVNAASVEKTFKTLKDTVFPGLKVGYVHGKMKATDQREAIKAFRDKEYDVLVSSTVVEVGVDIPDATRVVIMNAERLGVSSLWQIKGRVGRSNKPSKCYLISLGNTESSSIRMNAMVECEDGFDISRIDLKNRGEGSIFGSNQSGLSGMVFASLFKHADKIDEAREEAIKILKGPYAKKALEDAAESFGTDTRLM